MKKSVTASLRKSVHLLGVLACCSSLPSAAALAADNTCNPSDITFSEVIEAPPIAGDSQIVQNRYCNMAATSFNAISASPGGYLLLASCDESLLTVRAVVTNASRPSAQILLSADGFAQYGNDLTSNCGTISVQVTDEATNTVSVYIVPASNGSNGQ